MQSQVEQQIVNGPLQDRVLNSTMLSELSDWFWSPRFWLPDGMTWNEMQRKDVNYSDPTEIWTYPIIMAVIFYTLRVYVINPYMSIPLAKRLGVKQRVVKPPTPNATLESVYKKYDLKVSQEILETTASLTGYTSKQIQIWLRQRKSVDKITKLDKFQEIAFVALYHVIITIIAFVSLYDKPWVYDVYLCFEDYPHHSVDAGIWWLYMSALAFYWTMTVWQMVHVHGKDRKAQFTHHFSTIILISFSWTGGFFRMGSLILLVHEPTDIPLLLGKLCVYAEMKTSADILFGSFVVIWFITRVYLFPFWLLWTCFFEMPSRTMSLAVYIQYGFAFSLLILNMLWTIMITKVLLRKVFKGDKLEDVRSSDEMSDPEIDDKEKKN